MKNIRKKLHLSSNSDIQDSPEKTFNKIRIIKNIMVMCCGIFILLTACEGPAMLQSTMNKKEGIGVTQFAILYALYSITGLLLPKYVLKRFGSKRTLTIAMLVYALGLSSNAYPEWILVIPLSILTGFAAPLLWTAQESYLKDISFMFASLSESDKHNRDTESTRKNSELSIISQKTAYDSAFNFQNGFSTEKHSSNEVGAKPTMSSDCCQVHSQEHTSSAHLETSFVNDCLPTETISENNHVEKLNAVQTYAVECARIKTPSVSDKLMRKNVETITARVFGIHGMAVLSCHLWGNVLSHFLLKNGAHPTIIYNRTSCLCGYKYCNIKTDCLAETHEEILDRTRYTLTLVCFCLAVIGFAIIAIFLDPLKEKEDQTSVDFRLLKATFLIIKRLDSILLIPSSFYVGLIQGFYGAEFTKAYVSCAWSMYHVSLVSSCYGFFCAITSISSGWLVKLLGRVCVNTFTILLNIASCTLLLLWDPDASNPVMFFVVSGMIGTFVGIVYSQSRAFYGILFSEEKEAAFGAYHVWYSLGFTLSFAYSTFLCTSIKIYVLLFVSILGYFGYLIAERNYSLKKSKI